MKKIVLAGILSILGTASTAATMTFVGGPPGGTPYIEGDFQIDDVRVVNGRCAGSVSERPCAALNDNESFILSRVDGGAFTLTSFWFQLLGNGTGNGLSVSWAPAEPGPITGNTSFFTEDKYPNNNDGQVITSTFGETFAVTFSAFGGGNVRIDDLTFAEPAAVPVPAAGLMLLTALGGAAAVRRRKG